MSDDDVPRSLDFSLPVSRSLPSLRDGDDDDVPPTARLAVETAPGASVRDDDDADRPALGSGALRTPRALPRTFLRVSQHGSAEGIAKDPREDSAERSDAPADGHMSALSLLNIHSDVHLADSVAAAARRTERIVHEFASRHGSGSPAARRAARPRSAAASPAAPRRSDMTSWSAALAPSSPAIVRAETLGTPASAPVRSAVLEGVPSKPEFERALATVRRGLATHVGQGAQLAVLLPSAASQLAAADAQLPVMVHAPQQSALAPVVPMTPSRHSTAYASPAAVASPGRAGGIAATTARALAAVEDAASDAGGPATPQAAAARPARAPDSAYRQLLSSIDSMLATERARGFTSRPTLARGAHARVSELAAGDGAHPASPGTIITATIERAAAAVRAQAPPSPAPSSVAPSSVAAPASPALSAYNLGPASPARFRPPASDENERQLPAALAPKAVDAPTTPATPSVRSAASREARAILGESPTARRRNRQAPRQRVMF